MIVCDIKVQSYIPYVKQPGRRKTNSTYTSTGTNVYTSGHRVLSVRRLPFPVYKVFSEG